MILKIDRCQGRTVAHRTAAIIEQRGRFDDDDYNGFIAADEDAVYWKAGADPSMRTSDGDPLALFRTCRLK